jgi:hypothetical protein
VTAAARAGEAATSACGKEQELREEIFIFILYFYILIFLFLFFYFS